MKSINYLVIGVLLMVAAPLSAQNATELPEVKAVIDMVSTNSAQALKDGSKLTKKYKKQPEVGYAIGTAFLKAKDFDKANEIANQIIKQSPKAPEGHLLAGDIAYEQNDGGVAAAEYEQAIYLEDTNEQAYYKYASIYKGKSPDLAVDKLNQLKTKRPDLEVDRKIAEVYYFSNDFQKASELYGDIDRSKLDDKDLTNYAMALFMTHKYDESLEIAQHGLQKSPNSAAFNRLALYNLTDLKRYDEALPYAEALFNKAEDAKLSYMDKTYYGYALNGIKDYKGAISRFKEALEDPDVREDMKVSMMKTLADSYLEDEQYMEAATLMKQYLEKLGSKKTIGDMYELESLFCTEAEDTMLTMDQRKEAMSEAEQVYNDIMQIEAAKTLYQPVILLARTWSTLDPESTEGWAKPWYEKTAELLESLPEKNIKRLVECYSYLGYYYYIKDDRNEAKKADIYWNKILEIDPENIVAKKALGIS